MFVSPVSPSEGKSSVNVALNIAAGTYQVPVKRKIKKVG